MAHLPTTPEYSEIACKILQAGYFKFGFTFIEQDELQLFQCVICMKVLSNDSMRPNGLERHLKQPTSYF
ncbi:unnamed protein product [Acanthoscelides obtectus]|uniref:Uncharacterized protein n=1 Tax=Acanthoscelides obtectus TaxID=200917 RepID=A0A9P0KHX5_ACAOB|nr:unnamed protein product [Acanthoscelides obtectus]CAK1679947.1 hypothetical protein AOBTE_LOCUS32468 [Acanthoscelides obtectus]